MSKTKLELINNPKSIISESIKTIRINLLFSVPDSQLSTVLVTSTLQGEGKSSISSNLAVAFGQNDLRVLILDCDLRHGIMDTIFAIKGHQGLSNYLAVGKIEDIEDYILKTDTPNVDVITSGTVPPNPLELLSSKKMENLLNHLKTKYDLLVIDSPPVGVVADSLVLAKHVDRIIIVAAVNQATLKAIKNTKKQIENAGGNIAGVVVNKKPMTDKQYYNKYYK